MGRKAFQKRLNSSASSSSSSSTQTPGKSSKRKRSVRSEGKGSAPDALINCWMESRPPLPLVNGNGNGNAAALVSSPSSCRWLYPTFQSLADKERNIDGGGAGGASVEGAASLRAKLVGLKRDLHPVSLSYTAAYNARLMESFEVLVKRPATADGAFHLARVITNPFDVLSTKKGLNRLFVNRSAIKLANMDAILDFALTATGRDSEGGGFKFVDFCGAPGGFSEYLLWRCGSYEKKSAHGWGMSLRGENGEGRGCEWKLQVR